jgi:hypothetical protein
MESSYYGVDQFRAFEYQQSLREAAQQRLTTGIQGTSPAAVRGTRSALGEVIAWLLGRCFLFASRSERARSLVDNQTACIQPMQRYQPSQFRSDRPQPIRLRRTRSW